MRFHHCVAPGKQLHANAIACFEDFSFAWADAAGIRLRRIEERKNVEAVEASQTAEGGDGGTHLRALKRRQESNGDVNGLCDFCERIAALQTQTPQAWSHRA